ncbi:MAG: GSCFA domain-containing protein, partial [Prevotella sp.]|nr:GSCFA domain-containing protein [Prevotella sp.]
MKFRTIVDIPKANFEIPPCEEMLFVGSCFADNIGQRFEQEQFRVTVNPFGVMYNPISIFHTIEKLPVNTMFSVAILTLGTNHIYRLKETNEVVDNCAKRPQSLFREEEMSVDECAEYLLKSINLLRDKNPDVKVILTVSPIRYAKYGFHGSQLSKATLLMAISQVISQSTY